MTVDYYSLCETALANRIKTLTTFFPSAEFVTDDDAILNKGANYYAVFTPDTFTSTRVDGHTVDFDWNILLDIYTKYTTQTESKNRLKTIRAALVELIHPACLNSVNGVSRTIMSANGGFYQDAPERPNFVWQTFIVIVTQRVRYVF